MKGFYSGLKCVSKKGTIRKVKQLREKKKNFIICIKKFNVNVNIFIIVNYVLKLESLAECVCIYRLFCKLYNIMF